MNFTFTTQAPIVIFLHDGKDRVEIPRFKRKDWKLWAAIEDAKRSEEATKHLDAQKKAEFIAFYTIPSSSPREMRRLLMTYDGQEYVVKVCLKQVGWNDAKIDLFIEDNSQDAIEELAFALASVQPNLPQTKPVESKPTDQEGEEDPKKQPATTLQSV